MPAIPYPRDVQVNSNYSGRPAATWGDLVTAGGSTHTLGSIQELFSAAENTFDTYAVRIIPHSVSTTVTSTDMLLNIYVGASSAEQLLIPNLLAGWSATPNTAFPMRFYEFPLYIPAGTRISADCQSQIAGDTVRVMMDLVGGGLGQWAGRGVECLGADTANSRGTSLTPGGASDGSWTSVGTSTYEYKYVTVGSARNVDTTMLARWIAIDVGTGSAPLSGLENFLFQQNTSENSAPQPAGHGRIARIPAGTALQARAQVDSANTEATDVCIYGVYG